MGEEFLRRTRQLGGVTPADSPMLRRPVSVLTHELEIAFAEVARRERRCESTDVGAPGLLDLRRVRTVLR